MPISHLPSNFTRTTGPAFDAIAFQWAVADLQPKGRKSDRQKNFCWKKIISLPPKAEVIILPTQSMHYLKGFLKFTFDLHCLIPPIWVIQWTLENPFFITYPIINMGREKFMCYRVQQCHSLVMKYMPFWSLLLPHGSSLFLHFRPCFPILFHWDLKFSITWPWPSKNYNTGLLSWSWCTVYIISVISNYFAAPRSYPKRWAK